MDAKSLAYTDNFLIFKSEKKVSNDSFTFNFYPAFKGAKDVKTNNYSNLILSKNQLNSDWVKPDIEKIDYRYGLISTMSFFDSEAGDTKVPHYLYFDKNYEFWDIYVKTVPYKLVAEAPDKNYHTNFAFYIDFIDDTKCYIKHWFGDLIFYFSIDNDKTIQFTLEKNTNSEFIYNIDGNKLMLYKKLKINNVDKVFKLKVNDPDYNDPSIPLTIELDENIEPSNDSIIQLNTDIANLDFNPNNSYIKYDNSISVNSIDIDSSAFNLKGQFLFHHEYNTDGNINFIPLKNNLTYKGTSVRGDNHNISYSGYPDVDYRNYSNLHTGLNQERGNDTITLTYSFSDQEFTVKPGEDLFIYIPQENTAQGIYPLYPWKAINIADTKFIQNGAFGSDVPFFADKVKKMLANTASKTKKYKLEDGVIVVEDGDKPSYENSATYLCSWLYQRNEESEPIWLDRYYYPDLLSREKALTIKSVKDTLGSIIDRNYINNETGIKSIDTNRENNKQLIAENSFFDKVSDLVIEPGCNYKYSHLSAEMVNEVLDKIKNDSIEIVEDERGNEVPLSEYLNFDGKYYRKLDYSKWNKTNAINFNTDLYIEPTKPMGIQIFGTDYCSGFNIQNRKDLCPLHYQATEKSMYLFDDTFNISREFPLYEKYAEKISRFILGDVFDDLVVMTKEAFYFLSYDLKVKSRIEFSKLHTEDDMYENFFRVLAHDIEVPVKNEETKSAEKTNTIGKPIFYKNNIYIPFNQNIAKIIFSPEVDRDYTSDKKAKKIRFLDYSEFYFAFNVENTTDGDETINASTNILNIHIDDAGNIQALNFDDQALAPDGDTIYGIVKDSWSWIYNIRLSKVRASMSTSKYAEFGSPESIDFVRFNSNEEMGLIRCFETDESAKENNNNVKRLEVYDRTKKLIYTYPLRDYCEIYSFDSYNYITAEGEERTVFVIIANKGNETSPSISKIEYISGEFGKIEEEHILNYEYKPCVHYHESSNNNALMRYVHSNALYFNLYLPSVNMYNKALTIKWDIADIQTGWYNINVEIDLENAKFALKINDVLYQEYTAENTDDFEEHVNANKSIFNTTYYLGCIGKQYGTTLNDVLSSTVYDAYICKNCRVENMSLYTRNLAYHEYQAMRLKDKPISTLSLTLPCGNRNNIEEIVRYFKYSYPGSVSNKVKINISGTGLKTEGEFNIIKNDILDALRAQTDCLVDINEIEFI